MRSSVFPSVIWQVVWHRFMDSHILDSEEKTVLYISQFLHAKWYYFQINWYVTVKQDQRNHGK